MKRILMAVAAGGFTLAGLVVPAFADWPEAFYNNDDGRYHLAKRTHHLKLDMERLRERERERIAERERRKRELEAREIREAREAEHAYRIPPRGPEVRGWVSGAPRVMVEHCYGPIHAAGIEAHSDDQAKLTARVQWSSLVRWKYGEQYMDITNSPNVDFLCSQSSNDATTMLGKAMQGAVEGLTEKSYSRRRCEVIAQPCRAPISREGVR